MKDQVIEMDDSISNNFGGYVHEAIREGMNPKILYQLMAIRFDEFNASLRDDTFTIEQKNKILTAIKKWRKGE